MRIEDAQDVLREGPSLDAYRTGRAVTGLSALEQQDRCPVREELLTGMSTAGPYARWERVQSDVQQGAEMGGRGQIRAMRLPAAVGR
jgi:hypothetical protein